MEAGTDLDPQRAHGIGDRPRALHSAGGSVERDKEAVAHRLNLSSPVPGNLGSKDRVVLTADVLPAGIAQGSCQGRGVDDIRVHDRRQHAIELRLFDPERFHERRDVRDQVVEWVDVVVAWEFD
jgi:hypothetical protein